MRRSSPVVVELDRPASFLLERFARSGNRLVADDVQLVVVRSDEVFEESSDDRLHSGRNYYSGNFVLESPLKVLVESWVELNVLHQVVDALREWSVD